MHAPLQRAVAVAKAMGVRAWRTPAELTAYQEAQLRRLIEHAYANVPYYRALLGSHGITPVQIRTLADLDRIPISSKDDLRRQPMVDLLAAGLHPDRLRRLQTSGSSGKPFVLYRSSSERRLQHLFWMRLYRKYGQRLGDRIVWIVRPSPRESGFGRVAELLRAAGLENHTLDVTTPPPRLLHQLDRLRPNVVVGYPGMLARLGEDRLRDGRTGIRPRFILAGGEVLTAGRRAQIESTWDVPVHEIYSCKEMGLLAFQCSASGELHVCDDAVVLELLKDGRPVKVGERGEVVVTSLRSFAMPFIRYRIGDVATRGSTPCACGSPFGTIGQIQGRMLDFFRLPSGRLLHPYEVAFQLQEDGWVGQFQVVQEAADRIVVLIVPGPAFSQEKATAFEARAAAVVGAEAQVRAELVEKIEPAPGGKFHLARSLVPATEGEPAWHHSGPVG